MAIHWPSVSEPHPLVASFETVDELHEAIDALALKNPEELKLAASDWAGALFAVGNVGGPQQELLRGEGTDATFTFRGLQSSEIQTSGCQRILAVYYTWASECCCSCRPCS